jgi:site-specific recombinase XerD
MNALRFVPAEQREAAAPVPVEGAIEAFLREAENVRKLSAGTIAIYGNRLGLFKKFLKSKGVNDLQGITPAACAEFAQSTFEKHLTSTVKHKLVIYKIFFSWAAERYNLRVKTLFKGIAAPKAKSKPKEFWTVEECEKMIGAAANPEEKCWFALMAYAGLRKEEARRLRMENLEGGKISLVGKGGSAAAVPISSRLKTHLNGYLIHRGNAPGFLFPELSKMTAGNSRIIKAAAEKAGLSGRIHCHRFRHSFASNLIRAGRNIKAVQLLMRHKNVTLTLNTYGHLLPDDLEQAAEL